MSPNRCQARRATKADAEAAIEVLRASISGCVLDHQNDPEILARWLANKQPEIFGSWLDHPAGSYWVALIDEQICGVAAGHFPGKVVLCYVHPTHERKGVARALLGVLETDLRAQGAREIRLESSATARGFYERMGYRSSGDPIRFHNQMFSFPYLKQFND